MVRTENTKIPPQKKEKKEKKKSQILILSFLCLPPLVYDLLVDLLTLG
jgi:hypothetical protein